MVLPIPIIMKLVALGIAKKGVVYGIARQYGIPRVYRRILEVNRRITTDKSSRVYVKSKIESAFRLPNTIYASLKDSQVQKVVSEFYNKLGSRIFGSGK